ncbi:calcium-binding protein [Streptomyces scabiei]|uniref:calcium-binding protein n=4 Tax=Streptomyces scabiei TaxID=1930 RepID=UPI001B3214A5|nr:MULTISPECIES: calcium-binding protein [Streptomyces]MBP5863943.1 calcium-binding protein [Streptomyces sp. LBUM 1484]MBP5893930.1 calcium-binding protein [Streptomyces sp. LBUM 1481]MBP5899275.1 calcium-binding protein [Streptomyces sp. LBUM 1488]MBP5924183.1 calcium-binding protein [Streptomyces sp. LBUM 1483]MDX2689974.1 calcium-binding protein [Streptomyces scabiei]
MPTRGLPRRRAVTAPAVAVGAALALACVPLTASPALAAPAPAASLVHDRGELWFKAAPGQANRLTVSAKIVERTEWEADYVLTFNDRCAVTLAAKECTYPQPADRTVAECAVPIPMNSDDTDIYDVGLGDGNDTVTIAAADSAYATIHGGAGDDVLLGNRSVVLHGEDGDDRIDGGGGVWGLGSFGGRGDDVLGDCSYACHGGADDDTLTGGAESDGLYGDSGDDVLHGRAGADALHGGKGDDRLYGEDGDDRLYGNTGDDVLYGGRGRDTLSGGPGRDRLHQN